LGIFFRDRSCQSASADRAISTRIKVKVAILVRERKFVQETVMDIYERIYNEWTEYCKRRSRAVNEFTLATGWIKLENKLPGRTAA
jgi:hypothetical protein